LVCGLTSCARRRLAAGRPRHGVPSDLVVAASHRSSTRIYRGATGLYAAGAAGRVTMPWSRTDPHPLLVQWAHRARLTGAGRTAVVVGCALGADAEFVAGLGFTPTRASWRRHGHSLKPRSRAWPLTDCTPSPSRRQPCQANRPNFGGEPNTAAAEGPSAGRGLPRSRRPGQIRRAAVRDAEHSPRIGPPAVGVIMT
jgi:hypothetical protein